MTKLARLQGWYRDVRAKRCARHLSQPVYPFAGTVDILRDTTSRLVDAGHAAAYCESLPANVFCRVDERSVGWWILDDDMLWMAQVDRKNMNIAFAACAGSNSNNPDAKQRMRESVSLLYPKRDSSFVVAWDERLVELGQLSAKWMRRSKEGTCLPGLVVTGQRPADYMIPQAPIRTALRLQRPQRLEVAVPLILHSLWSDLRQENVGRSGDVADVWQLVSALVDNPWESWRTVRSGRFSEFYSA